MMQAERSRDAKGADVLLQRIRARVDRPLHFMEFCGTHTHAISRHGIRQLLPPQVTMHSGPGCPVCVTAAADVDRAIALAAVPGVTLATFGDMLRVPGSDGSLETARAKGADVRIVYSSLDALQLAREHPERIVVLLGIGFETTVPTIAAAVSQAAEEGLANFRLYSLHKLTPPAMAAVLQAEELALDGILAPGHVSAVIGADAWAFVANDHGLPCTVAGFEPLDILLAIADLVEQCAAGRGAIHNAYPRAVQPKGNLTAQRLIAQVFMPAPAEWRGLGPIADSGLQLRPEMQALDAQPLLVAHGLDRLQASTPAGCRCGDVLRGVLAPPQCALFGRACTPGRPLGPCMVSAEGSCAAYYRYGEAP